jgi:conjugal transfer pilus assembly protein TraB
MASDNISLTSPQKKRKESKYKLWLIGGLTVVFLIILATLMSDEPVVRERAEKFEGVGVVNDKDAANVVMDRRLRQMEKGIESLRGENKELEAELRRAKEKIKENEGLIEGSPFRVLEGFNGEERISSKERVRPENVPEGVVLPPKVRREKVGKVSASKLRNSPFNESRASESSGQQTVGANYSEKKEAQESEIRVLNQEDTETNSMLRRNKNIPAKSSIVKNKMAGFLPATTAVPIVIFTGIDAATGTNGQGNPQPVHFRIQDDGFMAGNGKYRLKGCHGQGSGYGDLSAQRVMVTVTRIVCLDVISDKILETKIKGYLTDSDNIAGFRGPVKNREGAIAGKAFAAAFIQGSAELLAANSTSISAVDGLAVQSTSTGSALRGGVIGGTSSAAEMLAERYIQQMEAIMPTIPLNAGRKGVMHMQEGKVLEWTEYSKEYIERIEPAKGKR